MNRGLLLKIFRDAAAKLERRTRDVGTRAYCCPCIMKAARGLRLGRGAISAFGEIMRDNKRPRFFWWPREPFEREARLLALLFAAEFVRTEGLP